MPLNVIETSSAACFICILRTQHATNIFSSCRWLSAGVFSQLWRETESHHGGRQTQLLSQLRRSTTSTTTPEEKPSFDQYYPTKTNPIKPDPMKIPKTEMNTSSCCSVQGQGELLVPKTEITSTCRSPPSSIRSHYEPYLNQDSNSLRCPVWTPSIREVSTKYILVGIWPSTITNNQGIYYLVLSEYSVI